MNRPPRQPVAHLIDRVTEFLDRGDHIDQRNQATLEAAINLRSFREDGGAERCVRYGREVAPHLELVGARLSRARRHLDLDDAGRRPAEGVVRCAS